MAFDIIGARKAGYSDDEIADHLAQKHSFDIQAARDSGYSSQEVLGHLISKSDVGSGEPSPAAPTKLPISKMGPNAANETVRPGAILSELDVNLTDTSDDADFLKGTQGAANLINAPQKEKAIPVYEQQDIIQAFDQAGRLKGVPTKLNRPLSEASAILDTEPKRGPLTFARDRMLQSHPKRSIDTRTFQEFDPSNEAAARQLEPLKGLIPDPLTGAIDSTEAIIAGIAENVATQATQYGAMTVGGIPLLLGGAGAEVIESLGHDELPSLTRIGERFREGADALTYKPLTDSGKRQVEATGQILTAIPRAVDALDSDDKFKANFPNFYATMQVAGEFAPWIAAGKMAKGPTGPKDRISKIGVKASQEDYNNLAKEYTDYVGAAEGTLEYDHAVGTINDMVKSVNGLSEGEVKAAVAKIKGMKTGNIGGDIETTAQEVASGKTTEVSKDVAGPDTKTGESIPKTPGRRSGLNVDAPDGETNAVVGEVVEGPRGETARTIPGVDVPDRLSKLAAKSQEGRATPGRWVIEEDTTAEEAKIADDSQPRKGKAKKAQVTGGTLEKAGETATEAGGEKAAVETGETVPVRGVDGGRGEGVRILRPAVRSGSDLVIGEPGSTHPDILEANPDIPEKAERGFAGPDGEFMTRDEAAGWLKENNPAVYDEWEKANPENDLHSQDLNKAVEKVDTPLRKYWKDKGLADKLSNNADKSGIQADHADAEKAHQDLAESLDGSSYAKYHEDMAAYHKKLASTKYLDRADDAIKNRDEESALKWLAKADEIDRAGMAPELRELPPEMRTTGIKNAVTEEERETIGKTPVEVQVRRSFGEAFDRGKAAVDEGRIDPRQLASRLADQPRALTAEESVALIYDRMRLQNDHAATMENIENAVKKDDKASELENRQRLAKIEDDINTNDEAARRTGYEQGLGLAARKMMIAEDYTLARSIQRARVAIGKELPAEIRAKIEDLTKQLNEAMAKSQAYEDKLAELEAQRKVQKVKNEADESPARKRREHRAESREELDTEFKALAGRLRAKLSKLNINFDPEDVTILGEMMRIRVLEGMNKAKDIVDDIYEELSDLEDVSKRDIQDAISNYGKSYKLSQDELQVELRELRRQMRLMSALDDVESGDLPEHSGLQRDPVSDEVRDLQRQIKDAMRESGLDATTNRSPEEKWKTALDSVKTRLKNDIHDLDQQIEAGKRTHKVKQPLEYDAEAKRLKALRDEKKALLDEIDAKSPKDQAALDAIHLKAYKTRTQKRIADLQRKLDTGDFEKSARRVLKMDPEAMRLKNEAEKVKEAINTEIRKQQLANRTTIERALDWSVKWRRAVILSGLQTVGKLTTAATMRQITTPLEEIMGAVLQYVPGIAQISAKAPREGGGMNVRAEAAAFRQWFEKQTWRDVKDVMKTGQGELDRLFGKKSDRPPELLEFFGRVHGSLKVTPKRAEFYRSLQKRTEFAMRQGLDMSDPTTQATITAEAYIDANRAIFMQDNAMVTSYRILINYLKLKGTGGKVAAATMQLLLPIVKIPTNFVAETTSYAAGGAKALGKVIAVKGIKNLKPEEADYVMRALKKQGIGLAMLAIGYFMAEAIGGYYQMGEKRKSGEVEAGGLRIFGINIPKWALHSPVLEVLQMGATLRRVQDHYADMNAKNDAKPESQRKPSKGSGTAAGVYAGARGVAGEIPFFEQPVRMGEALRTSETAGKWGAQLTESMIVPPDLRRVSKAMDKAGDQQIPREQNTLGQMLLGDIPGQRSNLPLDMVKVKRMQLDKLADIMENAPSYVVDELKPAFRKKFRAAKGLEPDERQRYLEILK